MFHEFTRLVRNLRSRLVPILGGDLDAQRLAQPVFDGTTLYARYVFSYRSKLPGAEGRRAMFEGVSIMTIRDGLIAAYREVANVAPGLTDLGFAPERIARISARQGTALRQHPEAARHLAP